MCDFYENLTCFSEIIDPQTFLAPKINIRRKFWGLRWRLRYAVPITKGSHVESPIAWFWNFGKISYRFRDLEKGVFGPQRLQKGQYPHFS
jgi:hypothetical protein